VKLSGQAGAEKKRQPNQRRRVVEDVRKAAFAAAEALLVMTPNSTPTATHVRSGIAP